MSGKAAKIQITEKQASPFFSKSIARRPHRNDWFNGQV